MCFLVILKNIIHPRILLLDSHMMIRQFLEYLRYEKNRSPLTLTAYEADINQFASWFGMENPDNLDFSSITTSDVRSWLAHMAKKEDTSRTLRRKAQSLRALFSWMVKTDKIKVSPVRDLQLPKIPKPLPEIVRQQEIETAIENASYKADENNVRSILEPLIVEMLYVLGLRRAEIAALNDSDISFTTTEIKVTGKRSKQRVIPLPISLIDKIRNWQEIRNKNMNIVDLNPPLFCVKGKRITGDQIYHIVRKTFINSTAKKKSPHALRHSFASGMLNGGANLDSVKEFLGHSSLATTQIYTHISINEIKNSYKLAHPRSSETKK